MGATKLWEDSIRPHEEWMKFMGIDPDTMVILQYLQVWQNGNIAHFDFPPPDLKKFLRNNLVCQMVFEGWILKDSVHIQQAYYYI
jgi:hypothetical protein